MCSNCRAFINASDKVCEYCGHQVGPRSIDLRMPDDLLGGLVPARRAATSVLMLANVGLYLGTVVVSMKSGNDGAFMNLDPMWSLGAAVQKQLFNKRSTLKLAFTDIFWTNLPSAFIKYTNYQEQFDVYRDTRMATVSYTHRFGDSQVAPSRRRAGGAEEEKQRAASGVQG